MDRAYEQLVEAIADGTLAPGQRIRQEELGLPSACRGSRSAMRCNCLSNRSW